MSCQNNCCYINYRCSSSSLNDPIGCFYFPSDGVKRAIYMSSTVRPTMNLTVTNTGYSNLIIELSQSTAGVITPKTYTIQSGKSQLISETNITNVYVTGYLSPTPCYPCCCNCRCRCNYNNAYYSGASGNYSITN